MRILQVNAADQGGGAERVALELHRGYRAAGHRAWLAVSARRSSEEGVLTIPYHVSAAEGWAYGAGRVLDRWRGREVFRYPSTGRLMDLTPEPPEVLHLHNLHGGYFDLRILPELSRRLPTFITLHDAWLSTGHCAHSLACGRWESGCGSCPDLTLYPALRRDATAFNWRRKREILSACRLHVISPSAWLLERARRSILAPAMTSARVIRNGMDLTVFRPGDRGEARNALGLPGNARIVLSVGSASSPWRDHALLLEAVARAAALTGIPVLALLLGSEGPVERRGAVEFRPLGRIENPTRVALHYRAADLLVHPALADTAPLVLLEAAASGIPAVATSVGGIPELVEEGRSAFLVPPGNPDSMAEAIANLLRDPDRAGAMGRTARALAESRFDLKAQVSAYLASYGEAA